MQREEENPVGTENSEGSNRYGVKVLRCVCVALRARVDGGGAAAAAAAATLILGRGDSTRYRDGKRESEECLAFASNGNEVKDRDPWGRVRCGCGWLPHLRGEADCVNSYIRANKMDRNDRTDGRCSFGLLFLSSMSLEETGRCIRLGFLSYCSSMRVVCFNFCLLTNYGGWNYLFLFGLRRLRCVVSSAGFL